MRKLRKAAVVVAVLGSVGLLGAGTSYAGVDAGGHSGHPKPGQQTTHRQQASHHTSRHRTARGTVRHQESGSRIVVQQQPPRYIIVRQQPSRTIIVRHRPSRSTVMRQQTTVINGQPQQQAAPQQAAPAQPQQAAPAAPQPQQQARPHTAPRQQSNRGRHEGGHVLVLRQSSACGTYDKNVDVFGEVGVANGWLPLHRWHDRRGDQHVRIGTSMGCNNVAHL
ncbi:MULTISPECIES: hypothetical protein [unclassified Streptomyces]|uniref:hypothetical protein n=1 Tax=unclassified Streptomyces TaxID=2593676 RepID=UPI0003A70ECE|nr:MULTISPECIES: hypothetical protein [unclassified Streptomyces]MYT28068.1 hypothetical protein [Streptomyces sp. SID8354]